MTKKKSYACVLGKYAEKRTIAEQLREYLKEQMIEHKILNGFVDVLVTNDVYDGINSLMQTTGVGGFRPNTVRRFSQYNSKLWLFLGDVW